MARKKIIQPYNIPEQVLNNLNEHCNRGFMLFTYDNLDNLRLYCNFDDAIVMKSLKSDIESYIEVMTNLQLNNAMQSMIGPSGQQDQ